MFALFLGTVTLPDVGITFADITAYFTLLVAALILPALFGINIVKVARWTIFRLVGAGTRGR